MKNTNLMISLIGLAIIALILLAYYIGTFSGLNSTKEVASPVVFVTHHTRGR